MNNHVHQILGTSMGTRRTPWYTSLYMGKEERTIILTFLHLIYFWKRFINNICFYFLGSLTQLGSLMTFMIKISPTIRCILLLLLTVAFLDLQVYLSESRKLKTKLHNKPLTV